MRPHAILTLLVVVLGGLLLGGCSSSDDPEGGEGSLSGDVARTSAPYFLVDLTTGDITPRAALPADLFTNADYTTTIMVFARVDGGTATIGSATDDFAAQSDETRTSVSVTEFYMSVFEVSQGQWETLMGTTPWTSVSSSVVGGVSNADDLPAYGISLDDAESLASTLDGLTSVSINLPTDTQWEAACRAGGNSLYSWGDSRTQSVVEDHAVVWETSFDDPGPRSVGGRDANGNGLYDMHGNVWEWTSDETIRGGSWHDTLANVRAANFIEIDRETAHALAGVRLILEP